MLFPTSILQSLLALYGLAPKPRPTRGPSTRRRPAPVLIGNPSARWR
jgi:hypothetical protein